MLRILGSLPVCSVHYLDTIHFTYLLSVIIPIPETVLLVTDDATRTIFV